MITYKSVKVSEQWLMEQIKRGDIKNADLKYIKVTTVDFKDDKVTRNIQQEKPTPKELPFNSFIKGENLKGRKLFGCIVLQDKARISLDKPVPYMEGMGLYPGMMEIPVECSTMSEQEVVEIIRRGEGNVS